MINLENFKLWTDALRSGNYPQAHGSMHRVDVSGIDVPGFCCMGVGCVTANVEEYTFYLEEKRLSVFGTHKRFLTAPDEFCLWLGLSSKFPHHHKFIQDCARWNDREELTFAVIADQIDAWVQTEITSY